MWVEMKLVAAAVIVLLVLDSVLGVVLMLASKRNCHVPRCWVLFTVSESIIYLSLSLSKNISLDQSID